MEEKQAAATPISETNSQHSEGLFFTKLARDFTKMPLSQQVFALMIVGVVPALIPFLYSFNEIVQMRKNKNPDYPWPEYDDLQIALYTCILMLAIKHYIERLAPYCDRFIHKRYQGQVRKERSKRFVYCLFKGSYFTFAVIAGYFVCKDANFMPPELGGTGSVANIFKDFPYQPFDSFPLVRPFIMMELGYHLHSLVDLLLHKSRNDFVEMLLHHLCTCFLVSLAYFMNYVAVSVLILLVHDISDVFVGFCRAFADTPYTVVSLSLLAGLYSTFAYYRLYFFPFYLIYHGYYEVFEGSDELYGRNVLGAMVHFLVCLHIYWFALLTNMYTRYWHSGVTEDIQQKLPEKAKQS
mmetsp:Transcript_4962/g.9330  ORF Transcript_4962/g.9330 Transcript_4962/m.9330 type:complete len:352 (+) Transcript_4962:62-1117(+)